MESRHGSVLIVDDEEDVRESLAAILEAEGYSVIEADNGEAALQQLEKSAAVCLILLDLFMPIMNGWTFRQKQLGEPAFAAIPVIVISADAAAARRAAALGVVDAITKPLDLERLLQVVSQHC
jgi:two-component system, chemotaxis family, chemotaxis protein CheY